MLRMLMAGIAAAVAISSSRLGRAEEAAPKSVEAVARACKPALVVITAKGRASDRDTLGTGFVASADGLIATNFHVVGEGRALSVELADGRKVDVISIEALDRQRDLALIKIGVKGLPALEIGDSEGLQDGQEVVALGNPRGLKHSVVAGVVSGRREIDGVAMIQLAIPLEPGNSGGPVVDMHGRVRGVITLKSLVSENLGYAVPVNALKPLIAAPHPVPMSAWVTIGALDPDEWKPQMGASWRQRAGRIRVQGLGSGFGGRSLCIFQPKPPALPFEATVTCKLSDEKGAAGLLFLHDGERHYGFYPTGGRLRLTRFDGPDVFSWKILKEVSSPFYKPGDWNTLKVRVAKEGIDCFVNNQRVIESDEPEWTAGQCGLCKFRDTAAEFRQFQVASKIEPVVIPKAEDAAQILKPLGEGGFSKTAPAAAIARLARSPSSPQLLREKALDLERQAAQLRSAASRVHAKQVTDELAAELAKPDEKADLIQAALLVARLDNEEVDVAAYQADLERMAKKLRATLSAKADEDAKLKALNRFFFEERGFHGSRTDYYSRSNSYLNEVIDDREGLPITLSILYLTLGERIGLKLAGVGMPGHFVVRFSPEEGESRFIDVFERGQTFTFEEARGRIADSGLEFRDEYVEPTKKRTIIVRILHNLLGAVKEEGDLDAGIRYLDAIIAVNPDAHDDRAVRALALFSQGRNAEALSDSDYLLRRGPGGEIKQRMQDLKRLIQREMDKE